MAWFTRFTRFGDMHAVFGQENGIACGVACAIMAAFKVNKLTPGTKAMFDEQTILKRATEMFGANPLGKEGLTAGRLKELLNDPLFKMPGWKLEGLPPESVPSRIIKSVGISPGFGPTVSVNPIIVLVSWSGGGGHWVLIDTVRTFNGKKYATVCDPWDSNVHVTRLRSSRDFAYTGQKVVGVDLWGEHHEYDAPSVGEVSTKVDDAFMGIVLYRDI